MFVNIRPGFIVTGLTLVASFMGCLGGLGYRQETGMLSFSEKPPRDLRESWRVTLGMGDGRVSFYIKKLLGDENSERIRERDFSVLTWRSIITHDSSINRYVLRAGIEFNANLCIGIGLAFLLFPAIAFTRLLTRTWQWYRAKRCFKCGFDLTGNVTGICSECGTAIRRVRNRSDGVNLVSTNPVNERSANDK